MFSEIYGAYYKAVTAILRQAGKGPVSARDIRRIAEENAFRESRAELSEMYGYGESRTKTALFRIRTSLKE